MKCRRRAGLVAGVIASLALALAAPLWAQQCKWTKGPAVAHQYMNGGPDYYGYYMFVWEWYGIQNCSASGAQTSCNWTIKYAGLKKDPATGSWNPGFNVSGSMPYRMNCGDPPMTINQGPTQASGTKGSYDFQVSYWWGGPMVGGYQLLSVDDNMFSIPF